MHTDVEGLHPFLFPTGSARNLPAVPIPVQEQPNQEEAARGGELPEGDFRQPVDGAVLAEGAGGQQDGQTGGKEERD